MTVILYLIVLVVLPLLLLAHVGPLFARSKTSFWLLSALALALALGGWAMFYFVDLTPENFSDVGVPWSMMLYTTLTSMALAAITLSALRVFGVWQPASRLAWLGYVAAFFALTALLWMPVGFAGQRATAERHSAVYCAKYDSNPSCNDVNAP